jgi:ankyrin repeat protein
VKLLLGSDGDLRRRQFELTPVALAMKAAQPAVVRLLVDKGAEHSPIHVAAYTGDLNELKRYRAASGDLNAQDTSGMSLLACAVCGAHDRAVQWLLDNGADLDRRGGAGRTPLHWACMTGRDDSIARLLVERGANVNAEDARERRTALHLAVTREEKELTELLLNKGANVSARTGRIVVHDGFDEGWTPLHSACEAGDKAIIELLLARGADANAATKNGHTPLSLTREHHRTRIVELLSQHGARDRAASN